MMTRDYDCIPKWCLPIDFKKLPIVDPKLDDSMTESELLCFVNSDFNDLSDSIDSTKLLAIDSENRSVRCENQQYEDQSQEIVLSADHSDKPRCHERETYGHLTNNSEHFSPPLPDVVNNSNAGYKNNGGGHKI